MASYVELHNSVTQWLLQNPKWEGESEDDYKVRLVEFFLYTPPACIVYEGQDVYRPASQQALL